MTGIDVIAEQVVKLGTALIEAEKQNVELFKSQQSMNERLIGIIGTNTQLIDDLNTRISRLEQQVRSILKSQTETC